MVRDQESRTLLSPIGYLSYDVASGSEITPCNKICKPLVKLVPSCSKLTMANVGERTSLITSGLSIFGKRYDVHNNVGYIMTKL